MPGYARQVPRAIGQVHATTRPTRRMGTAEEVAKLVLFLLRDESSYITGAEVSINGGVSL